MITVTLKPSREKPVRSGHPWIFSGAVARVDGALAQGGLCVVRSSHGDPLGTGFFNPESSIRVRMLCGESITDIEALVRRRFAAAVALRKERIAPSATAYRLINAEGDFLPGLVVDRFGNGVCLQMHSALMESYRGLVVQLLQEYCSADFIYDVSDEHFRAREGLKPCAGLLAGSCPDTIIIEESGIKYAVSPGAGQKTGFYCDQRDNRALVAQYARNRDVLDCFCYSGGFSLRALAAGAKAVVAVDSSRPALELLCRNAALNGLTEPDCWCADVFSWLREQTRQFGLVILDPPKLAKTAADTDRAARAYKDVNLAGIRSVEPGGYLATFSCSQAVDTRLFRQIVFAAAADSGRQIQVLHLLGQPPDHPVNIAHLEGEYLKGLVLRVV